MLVLFFAIAVLVLLAAALPSKARQTVVQQRACAEQEAAAPQGAVL